MTQDQIAGFAYRDAIQKVRDYYEPGWPQDSCALVLCVIDRIENEAQKLFAASQPGKSFEAFRTTLPTRREPK